MDTVWQELIKALPWGFVIIALRYLDIKEKADERKERDVNAKEKSGADRETAQFVAKSYADAINALARSVAENSIRLESTIKDFRETVTKQYENMGITQDLLDVARGELAKKRKE
jgi:hypothetical protein